MDDERELWTNWVREWKASGRSAQSFCAEHGLSRSKLYRWRCRLGSGSAQEGPLKVARVVPVSRPTSVEVTRIRIEVDGLDAGLHLMRGLLSSERT